MQQEVGGINEVRVGCHVIQADKHSCIAMVDVNLTKVKFTHHRFLTTGFDLIDDIIFYGCKWMDELIVLETMVVWFVVFCRDELLVFSLVSCPAAFVVTKSDAW